MTAKKSSLEILLIIFKWKAEYSSFVYTDWGDIYATHTYLARGITVIKKAVPPGRGLFIALRMGWTLRLPQIGVARAHNFW